MRTGLKFAIWAMAAVLCLGSIASASAPQQQRHPRKTKKQELPPLPNGPQGPIPQLPLDSVPAVAPQVTYHDGQMTILAPNSTLGDILRAVHKQTGADLEVPAGANERVVTQLGPGTARDVIAELLNGSRFNYVLLGSPSDPNKLTRVVLVAKTGGEPAGGVPNSAPGPAVAQQQPMAQPEQEVMQDGAEAEAPPDESATDETADQSAEAEQQATDQPQATPDQPGVKTPQQLLQEMQQRQLQMQQQANPGQPVPGTPGPYPQAPPQQQPQQQ